MLTLQETVALERLRTFHQVIMMGWRSHPPALYLHCPLEFSVKRELFFFFFFYVHIVQYSSHLPASLNYGTLEQWLLPTESQCEKNHLMILMISTSKKGYKVSRLKTNYLLVLGMDPGASHLQGKGSPTEPLLWYLILFLALCPGITRRSSQGTIFSLGNQTQVG